LSLKNLPGDCMYQFRHVIVLFFILAAGAGLLLAGDLRFASENIDVRILPPDTVEVTGEYFFASSDSSACAGRVIYPFPADSGAGDPFGIIVRQNDTRKDLPFGRVVRGITFAVEVHEKGTTGITVIYRQRFATGTGRYILTTTAGWGRPLVNSRYSLHVPVNTVLEYLSYECDTVFTSGTDLTYYFFKREFMPDRDLVFSWHDATGRGAAAKK